VSPLRPRGSSLAVRSTASPPVWPRSHPAATALRHLVLFLPKRPFLDGWTCLYGAHASGRGRRALFLTHPSAEGDGGGGGEGAGGEPGGGGARGGGHGAAGVERGRGGGSGRDGVDRAGGGHGLRVAGVVGVRGHLLLPRALRRDHVRAHTRAHVARPRRAGDPPTQRHRRREGSGWSDPNPCPFPAVTSLCSIWLLSYERVCYIGSGITLS